MGNNLIIGITGLFASGKSTVAKIFVESGFYEIDVDAYGYKALKDKKNEIVKIFGDEILSNDEINRKMLGGIVFNSKESLEKLNNIVNPYMKKCIEEDLKNFNNKEIIINAALLLQMKLHTLCNKVLVVLSDYESIVKRGMERDGRNLEQINFIISNQATTNQLMEIADYLIKNDSNIDTLIKNTKQIIQKIRMENTK